VVVRSFSERFGSSFGSPLFRPYYYGNVAGVPHPASGLNDHFHFASHHG
jgi:hypothetical protein